MPDPSDCNCVEDFTCSKHREAHFDFESPEEVAKRALCAKEGHVTKDHLGTAEVTHGTKDCCLRCGKFWHGEPTPEEIK